MGGGKSVMPVQHSKSIRERYHRYPVALADVPEELSNRVKEVLNKDFRVEWDGTEDRDDCRATPLISVTADDW